MTLQAIFCLISFCSLNAFGNPCETRLNGTAESNLKEQESRRDFSYYASQMDASVEEKLSVIMPWIRPSDRLIVDVGTGTGKLASVLAEAMPRSLVIGSDLSSDMLKIAEESFPNRKNLLFMKAPADHLPLPNIDVLIYSSILHEVRSYDPNGLEAVDSALKEAYRKLKPGGRIVIRDFVRPTNGDQFVTFTHAKTDIDKDRTFFKFVNRFGYGAEGEFGDMSTAQAISYRAKLRWVYEYIFRKDYKNNWDAELKELYGFWTFEQAVGMVRSAGFKIIEARRIRNEWIIENRLKTKIRIFASDGSEIDYPDYQIVIVGEKRK